MSGAFSGVARLSAAVTRVLGRDGAPVGAGFVIGPRHIATCAHVVAAAVDAGAEPADAELTIDFPLLPGIPRTTAQVSRWQPIRPDGGGDIAVLEIADPLPAAVAPPPLWRADRPWGREFRMIGFPIELPDGAWTSGEFRAPQGTGWLQLQGATGSQPITGGFSGAPVWDVGSEAVVGMAVAADRRRYTRTAFLIPATEVLGGDPQLLPNPYRGLAPFGENDSRLFYGRDADIERVLQALRERPVVAIAGRSGTGKSSLVLAGVAPRLRESGTRIEYVSADSATPVTAPDEQVLLVADQFEELVATEPARAREQLRALLERSTDPAVRVLLTLRWDSVDELVDDLAHALDGATIALAPMGREQLRAAIRGPASHAPGVDIDDALVERLIDDTAGEPGGLPLLESLLTELWEHRRSGRLTIADYERVGRAAGSIARQAERAFEQFTTLADRAAAQRLLTMLAAPRGDGFVRTPVVISAYPELHSVAGRLMRDRLLVGGPDGSGAEVVELAHQSLIENWPRLREWLELDRDFLSWQHKTDEQRRTWESSARDQGALLRGSALSAAEEWLSARAPDIPEPIRDYLAAGTRVRRREVRRWRVVTAFLAVLVLVAAGTAVVAYRTSAQRAAALRMQAGIALAEESLRLAGSQPNAALQFAQAAVGLAPNAHQVEAALLTQQVRMAGATSIRTGLWHDARLVVADDTASVVAIGTGEGLVTVWPGLLDGATDPWRLPVTGVTALALSGDGRKLATANTVGGVQLWDVPSRTGPAQVRPDGPARLPATATAAKFSSDGTRLVISHDPHRSLLSVNDLNRTPSDVGAADTVETFDTGGGSPIRIAVFTTDTRMDLLPLRVDPGRRETWFAETDATGRQRNNLRTEQGQTLELPSNELRARRTSLAGCGPDHPGVVAVREPTGLRVYDVGFGCFKAGPIADFDLDKSGRYGVMSFAPENGLFETLQVMDPAAQGVTYTVQVRYQNTGKRAYLVRPGRAGPELFVIGADDLTAHAPGSRAVSLNEFDRIPAEMAWNPAADTIAEFDGKALVLRQVRPEVRPIASTAVDWPYGGEHVTLDFSADGKFLIAGFETHELLVYSVPDLRLVQRIVLPVPAEYQDTTTRRVPVHVAPQHDDVIAVLHTGMVTRWHAGTAVPVGDPQQIWQSPDELPVIAEQGTAIAHGGFPDELAILIRDRIMVWDTAQGRRVRVLTGSETDQMQSAFMNSDVPLAYVWTQQQRVERWNTATGSIDLAPVAVPNAHAFQLTRNGLVVVVWENGQIQISDTERGTLVSGQLPWPRVRKQLTSVGNSVFLISKNGLFSLNLERTNILERLCAISDREFTDTERALLPVGATADRPCAG